MAVVATAVPKEIGTAFANNGTEIVKLDQKRAVK